MLIEIAVVLPILLWIGFAIVLPRGSFHMDQGEHSGSFFPLLILYMTMVMALGISCLLTFIAGLVTVAL